MVIVYRIIVLAYNLLIWLFQPFNTKAKLWIKGRRNIWKSIETLNLKEKVVWFHVSSLGEFEQGRPLIEELKIKYPEISVVLTFFSPSGYEIRKNYTYADAVLYLPIDSPTNARKFYNSIKPVLVVFVKYDFWYFYIREAKQRNIPIILISAVFKSNHVFFKWYGGFYRKMLSFFNQIFVQDQHSASLLGKIGISGNIAGDTRCDRVLQIAQNPLPLDEVQQIIQGRFTIVLGSLWNEDLVIIKDILNHSSKDIFWIIAPHNIEVSYITILEKQLTLPTIRYSELAQNNKDNSLAQVLIVDNIGKLSSLYRFAHIAYIGGGFGKGIHNILEPAVFSIPVIFGPKYQKFIEAIEMIQCGAAYSIKNTEEAEKIFKLLINDKQQREQAGKIAFQYIQNKAGATQKILSHLSTILS